MMRFFFSLLCLVLLAPLTLAAPASPAILPETFAGWQRSGAVVRSQDAAVADVTGAALLKEYAFTDFESATYTSDGRKLTIKAARFADASGALGAFSSYRIPEMLKENIGDQSASANERVLFFRGNVLVDAVFEGLTAMSAAELRELARALPLPGGTAANLPTLPLYLPRQAVVKNSMRYLLGPVAMTKAAVPLSPELVDFSLSAELATAEYQSAAGTATVTVISYPTPQIAAERLRGIDAAKQNDEAAGTFHTRRSGPLVVVVAGNMSADDAKKLLGAVNYDAKVTWDEKTYLSPRDNPGNLIVGVILLTGIVLAFALISGVAFGGVRILLNRLFPGRVFGRPGQTEFISLHLDRIQERSPDPNASGSIKNS